jgi:hypothetical protein
LLDEAVRALMEAAALPATWLEEMPYAVISIDEFETAIGVTNTTGIIAFWDGKLRDADRRRWPFRSYCNGDFANEVRALPDLFKDEFDAMFLDISSRASTQPLARRAD